ncbi:hypothetical protein [Acetobacter orientalis]|uniref:hypothetical protein n=1 Tax=Acetobacter orientalis TaxID=146474 RepID=UPI0039EA1E00
MVEKINVFISRNINFFLLIVFSSLILLRLPNVILYGRFLQEEGVVFFAYAWHFPEWSSLWRPFGGYLNFGANISTFLAVHFVKSNIISLFYATYITILFSFFFQIQSAVIILWGKAPWLNSKYIKSILLLVIALCPFSEEVWLNVLHVQYQLILCCGLILALDTPKKNIVWLYQGFILLFAPLCGPGAIALGPLFLLRSLWEKSLPRLLQNIILGMGSLVQLLLFFSHSVVRGNFLNPFTLFSIILVRLGVYPLLGAGFGRAMGNLFSLHYGHYNFTVCIFYFISIFYFCFLIYLSIKYRNIAVFWFIGVALTLALISFGGGMISTSVSSWFNAKDGERYGFIPLVFLEMSVVILAFNLRGNSKYFARLICVLMIFVGLKSYFKPIESIKSGPDWKQQVKIWQHDHAHIVEVWGWPLPFGMNLSDVNRRCPVVSLKTASYNDPTYCETNWIAHVLALPR